MAGRRNRGAMAPAKYSDRDGDRDARRRDSHDDDAIETRTRRRRAHGTHWRETPVRRTRQRDPRRTDDFGHRSLRSLYDADLSDGYESESRIPHHDGILRVPDAGGQRAIYPRK